MAETKPNRLKLFESEKGTKRDAEAPLLQAGGVAFQSNLDGVLDALEAGKEIPVNKKARVEEKKTEPKTEVKATKAEGKAEPAASAKGGDGVPVESVTDLLKKFSM